MIRRGECGWVEVVWAFMVARGWGMLLYLHTSTVQLAAQKLYEKHGYHEVGRETHQQFEIVLYEKALDS